MHAVTVVPGSGSVVTCVSDVPVRAGVVPSPVLTWVPLAACVVPWRTASAAWALAAAAGMLVPAPVEPAPLDCPQAPGEPGC